MTTPEKSASAPDAAPPAAEPIPGTLGFLGTGNMAEALIKGILRAGVFRAESIWGSDPRKSRCDVIKERYGIGVTTHNLDVVRKASIVVLSVKPQALVNVCEEISPYLKPRALVLSVAAGVPLAVLQAHLPKGTRIIRVMPNTPALVGAGGDRDRGRG